MKRSLKGSRSTKIKKDSLLEEAAKEIHSAFGDVLDPNESEEFWWTNRAKNISPKPAEFLNELIIHGDTKLAAVFCQPRTLIFVNISFR